MSDVAVVGAGIVGLTCAAALREAGHDVEVVARDEPTVSEVAGGLWLPYSTGEDERTLAWARATYDWLEARGVPLVDYVHIERAEPRWLGALPPGRVREVEPVPRRGRSWIARVPLVRMPEHLSALREATGPVRREDVRDLASLARIVVNCTGLGSSDPDLVPVRGQVVHVRPVPGVPCVCDEDELTYVLPRGDVIVCGGTHQPGDTELEPREVETRDILERCARLVPVLEGAEVLAVKVGLRPVRRSGVRLEREGNVVHCYGHGGAGVTLSWGCAQEVAEIVRTAAAR
jgi:D-amino-acid oxidase